MTAADAGEELGDVRGAVTPAQQIVDRRQLAEVNVVVERRPTHATRGVEQTAFTVGTDVADADSREAGQLVYSILSQLGTLPICRSGHWDTAFRTRHITTL